MFFAYWYIVHAVAQEGSLPGLLRYKYANFMSSSRPYSVSPACDAQELSGSPVPIAHQSQTVHSSPKDLPLVRLGRRRAGRRCIVVFVRVNVLRRLHLYVVLVAVVALVSTSVLILVVGVVAVVASRGGRARRGLVTGVIVRGVCWRCAVGQLARPASASVRVSTKLSSSSLRQTAG